MNTSPADRVIDLVNAAAISDFQHGLAEVLLAVVDSVVGAVGAHQVEFFLGTGGGDDGRAQDLADFDRGNADAAGGPRAPASQSPFCTSSRCGQVSEAMEVP